MTSRGSRRRPLSGSELKERGRREAPFSIIEFLISPFSIDTGVSSCCMSLVQPGCHEVELSSEVGVRYTPLFG